MTQPPDRPYALSPIGKREIEQFGIEIVVLGIPQQLVQPTAMLHPVEQPGLRSSLRISRKPDSTAPIAIRSVVTG